MANENVKVLHTRMRQKRVEASKWETAKTRTPLDGELIIYKGSWKGSTSTTSIFVGDGKKPLSSLNPIGTYNHNESELSWDGEVTVGYVGADAITVSLPKPTFAAESATVSNGQSGVALKFTAGKTPQTIGIYNTSGDNVVQYDSTNKIIKVDAPPTNHASSKTTYGVATNTLYGHVKVANVRDDAINNPLVGAQFADGAKFYGVERDKNGVAFVALPNASSDTSGLVKTGYISSGQKYGVEADNKGTLYVNVPWTDTYHIPSFEGGLILATGVGEQNLCIPVAATDQLGVVRPAAVRDTNLGVETGLTTSGRYYGVELDSTDKMFVNVPWENIYHVPSFSTGLSIADGEGEDDLYVPAATTDTLGVVKLGYTTSANSYAVQKNSDDRLYVYIPDATKSQRGVVKLGYTSTGKNYAVQKDALGDLYVNVPWANTTYSYATSDTAGLVRVKKDGSTLYLYNTSAS